MNDGDDRLDVPRETRLSHHESMMKTICRLSDTAELERDEPRRSRIHIQLHQPKLLLPMAEQPAAVDSYRMKLTL